MGAFMSYVLIRQEHDATRLLLKIVMRSVLENTILGMSLTETRDGGLVSLRLSP